jgi:hypothetical protein
LATHLVPSRAVAIRAEVEPHASDSSVERSHVRITGPDGGSASAELFVPPGPPERRPAILVLAERGAGAAPAPAWVTRIEGATVLVLEGELAADGHRARDAFFGGLPGVRRSALSAIPPALLAVDYLRQRPDVDASRIALLGHDSAALLVPCVATVDRGFALAVMVLEGADLGTVIARSLPGPRSIATRVAGLIGSALLRDVHPMRFAAGVSPTPLLVIASRPRGGPAQSAERLFRKARKPKKLVWLDGHPSALGGPATGGAASALRTELLAAGFLNGVLRA